jgi:hypothetical protein
MNSFNVTQTGQTKVGLKDKMILGRPKQENSMDEAKNDAENAAVLTRNETDDKHKIGCHVCHEYFRMPTELNEHVRAKHPNAFSGGGAKKFGDVIDLCSSSEDEDEEETNEDDESDEDFVMSDDGGESSDDDWTDDEWTDDRSEDEGSVEDRGRQGVSSKINSKPDQQQNNVGQSTLKQHCDVSTPSTSSLHAADAVQPETGATKGRESKKRKSSTRAGSISKRHCSDDNNCSYEKYLEKVEPDSDKLREFRHRMMKIGRQVCSYCSYHSERQVTLYRHVAAKHLHSYLKKTFVKAGNQCAKCGSKLSSSNGLFSHLGNKHKMIPRKMIKASKKSLKVKKLTYDEETTWSCFICPMKPTSAYNTVSHLITHLKKEVNSSFYLIRICRVNHVGIVVVEGLDPTRKKVSTGYKLSLGYSVKD